MSITTVRLGAVIAEEMQTNGNTMKRRVVGKIAILTIGTLAGSKKFLANRKFVDVVLEAASVAMGA